MRWQAVNVDPTRYSIWTMHPTHPSYKPHRALAAGRSAVGHVSGHAIGLVLVLALSIGMSSCDLLSGLFGGSAGDGDSAPLTEPLAADDSVTDSSGNSYSVGYEQVSSENQDPRVTKRSATGDLVWTVAHDTSSVDSKALQVALDSSERPYVTFTVDGGSYDGGYITRAQVESGAFDSAPFPGFGAGGNKAVTIVARLNPDTGAIQAATFLRARLNSGNANTLRPTGLSVAAGTEGGVSVYLDVESAAWPPAAGATAANWIRFDESVFNNDTRPPLRYELSADLSEIVSVEARPE